MKKILFFVFVLALFTLPQTAQAKINLYGQLDFMGASWQGYQSWKYVGSGFQNEYSFTDTRFFLGANFNLDKNIEADMAFLHVRSWGEDYIAGQTLDDSATNDGVMNNIRIVKANVVLKNLFDNDRMSLKIGKFFYGEKGDSIFYIGLRDITKFGANYTKSGLYNTSYYESGMDGVQLTYDTNEKFKIDFVYSKISNENTTYTGGDKINMFIADAKYKINDNIKARGYLYDSEETTGHNIMGIGNRKEIVGIKSEVKFGSLSGALEYAQQFISMESKLFDEALNDANFVKADISYLFDLKKDLTLTPRFTYLRAGGEFYAKFSDANWGTVFSNFWFWNNTGLFNTESYDLGIDLAISNKYKLSADYFKFSTSSGFNPWHEIDLKAEYYYTQQVNFYLIYSYIESELHSSDYYSCLAIGAGYKF